MLYLETRKRLESWRLPMEFYDHPSGTKNHHKCQPVLKKVLEAIARHHAWFCFGSIIKDLITVVNEASDPPPLEIHRNKPPHSGPKQKVRSGLGSPVTARFSFGHVSGQARSLLGLDGTWVDKRKARGAGILGVVESHGGGSLERGIHTAIQKMMG
ncbi:hypothetical protein RRG08_030216 [Elysia crispata]|uniref:Uncharacterized protein n=1 Tax=Elysia crispata TaxID=231223 RepID=A0AAE1AIM9_9GAST|nr:hypothetical protein RRG08_030216 [Elysia crispata]